MKKKDVAFVLVFVFLLLVACTTPIAVTPMPEKSDSNAYLYVDDLRFTMTDIQCEMHTDDNILECVGLDRVIRIYNPMNVVVSRY